MINAPSNRLINEKSPYLLQHAHNPVDWWPWCEEAFEEAKRRDVPVFLSIGYSTCHWCHVMERESFESEEVADEMNRNFVAIKVDREERPDVDHIYMNACLAMNGTGGWPLSCFLRPDKRPFFAGTYFPKDARQGMTGFINLCQAISKIWNEDREKFDTIAEKMIEHCEERFDKTGEVDDKLVSEAVAALVKTFDDKFGGFGSQPKFPSSHKLMFLNRMNGDPESAEIHIVRHTLNCMAQGGLRDHVGGGFFRYCTERRWMIPHFEKMLYDNALLLYSYAEANVRFPGEYAAICDEITGFVFRDMTAPDGGFYTAWDADSDSQEGNFYLFTPKDISGILGDASERFCALYDITAKGNFGQKSIPNTIGKSFSEDDAAFAADCMKKVFEAREKRIKPFRDEKIVLSTNGLMIAAMSYAGRILGRDDMIKAAERAADFALKKLVSSGRLYASYTDGKLGAPASLDGYAALIWGLLELYAATFDINRLASAVDLSARVQSLFASEQGGYYFDGSDVIDLPVRTINAFDGAVPSGFSMTVMNYARLFRLTGNPECRSHAEKALDSIAGYFADAPVGYCWAMAAKHSLLAGGNDVVLTPGEGFEDMLSAVNADPLFTLAVLADGSKKTAKLIPHTSGLKPVDGKSSAQICKNGTCALPVTSPEEVRAAISGK